MDLYNYYNADYEIYQSVPERINDDVEFTTDLVEISPQQIFDKEPFDGSLNSLQLSGLKNQNKLNIHNFNYNSNNYPKYNNNTLKIFLIIGLLIIVIIFIVVHFF